ncbi:hypothetical protein [Streptomyces sp. NPDC051561]|uniref:hypothetical protein n=1 Tax=Streptomyces sp. NPDC051561 TaxID=3365658 RepID=UPI0037988322
MGSEIQRIEKLCKRKRSKASYEAISEWKQDFEDTSYEHIEALAEKLDALREGAGAELSELVTAAQELNSQGLTSNAYTARLEVVQNAWEAFISEDDPVAGLTDKWGGVH